MTATLTLPYPISANRYWSNYVLPGSKRALQGPSVEAKRYKRLVSQLAMAAGMRPTMANVEVELILHPKAPKDAAKRERIEGPHWHLNVRCLDVDNCVKVALDALEGVAFANDDQILTLIVNRGMPTPNGALFVRVAHVDALKSYPAAPQMGLAFEDESDPLAEVA
jgi:crossover junction endodeoxyribonuclease RusA